MKARRRWPHGRTRRRTPRPGSLTASPRPGNDGAEVAGEHVEVVTYAAAIDVAKGSGMVCTRVPGSRPDRRRQTVWQAGATYASVVALMDHLRCQGIQRLVPGSTSDYWRIWYYLAEAAGLEVWLASARDVRHPPGPVFARAPGGHQSVVSSEHCRIGHSGHGLAAG